MLSLKLKNFGKYSEGIFDLGPTTLIKGKNGSGKSTILEGLNYVLTGSVRRLPKKNDELIKLANLINNSTSFEVSANINGINICRGLTRGRTVKENLTTSLLDSEKSSLAERNSEIKNYFSIQEELLNPIKLGSLTPTEKSKYLLSLLKVNTSTEKLMKIISPIEELKDVYSKDIDIFENIDMIKKHTSSIKRSLNKEIKDLNSNSEKISMMKQELMSLPVTNKANYNSLLKEISDIKSKLSNIERDKNRMVNLKSKLNVLKNSSSDNIEETIKNLENEISELKKKIVSPDGINKTISDLRKKLDTLKDEIINSNTELSSIINDIKNITDKGKGFKSLVESKRCAIDQNIICNSCADFTSHMNILRCNLKKLMNKEKEIRQASSKLNDNYKEISHKLDYALEVQKNLNNSNNNFNNKIIELQNKINKYLSNKMNSSKEIELLSLQLKEIKLEDSSILEKLLKVKEEEASKILENNTTLTKIKVNIELAEKSDLKKEEMKEKVLVLKSIEKSLDLYKLELLNSGISPFLEKMNDILADIDYPKKAFVSSDGKKATIGFTDGKSNFEFDTLSTGEGNIFIIALIGAIYSVLNCKLKVLALDDIDNIDNENLSKLLSSIPKLNKYFDNIILLGVLENFDFSKYNQFDIIEL
ncbi:AAA family ATPase [Clostridium thermobutyricum]|uniref:AAA family ATPase n=1 Tax=Clostridium thermobutyricum TaxID=29372 RepID=UPI0018A9AFBE|nr:AAA family ATPase [Clostridium thermobutyricum]